MAMMLMRRIRKKDKGMESGNDMVLARSELGLWALLGR